MPSVPGLEGRISARMMGLLCRQDSAGPASTSAHPLPVCACCLPPFSPRPSLHGSSASPSPTSTCPSQPVSLVPHFTLCLSLPSTPSTLPLHLLFQLSFLSFPPSLPLSPSSAHFQSHHQPTDTVQALANPWCSITEEACSIYPAVPLGYEAITRPILN